VQIFNSTGKYQSRYQGGTPDISHILMFYWFEPVLYLDPIPKFPKTIKRPGYFLGFVHNVRDSLRFKILKNYLVIAFYTNVARSAANAIHCNKRVSFDSNVLKLEDT
jgi:hypothetical protein